MTRPIPVRLEAGLITRLDLAAQKIHHTRAGIIRLCLETWLAHFERHGFAALPPNWEAILAEYDGRTYLAKAAKAAKEAATQRKGKPAYSSGGRGSAG